MDQARVTDYFRSCKRQNIYTNKQLNSSKVKALCDENVEALYKSRSNIDYVSYLKDDLQLKKSTIRKDGKSLLPKKPTVLGLVCEAGTESLLELESTPKSRKLNDTVNSTPVLLNSNRSTRSSKLKKQKLKNENLLKTPSTPSFVHNNKPVSQTIRKRLLLQEDCQASSSRCKILKFENSEENVEECSEKDIDANFILKNEVVNEEGSSDINLNEGEKNASVISSSNKNTCQTSFHIDKDRKLTSLDVAELPNKINDKRTNFNDTKEGKEAETEVKVHLTNYKNNLKSGDTSQTRSVQPLIAPVAQKQSKDVSFGSVKEGKLKEIQEKLSKLSSLKAKLKVTQEKSSELKEKNRIETPAFQKYHYLASSSSKSLILPYKYKSLELCFQSCDRAVSFLHNRHEVCTFSKLKHSVQEMTKRTFRKTHLGQIKSVFPEAYEFSLEKGLSILSTGGSSGDSLLTVIPNFDYGDNVTLDSVGPLCTLIPNTHIHVAQVSSTNRTSEKPFVAMNSTRLSERLRIFHNNLFERTNNYHEEFLSTLNPPVHVPREKVLRWHPRFPLDNVPDIPVAPLPEPLDNNHYPTAKDVLNLIKDKLEPKVENALQNVADEHKEIEVSAKQNQTELVQKGALKGISQALVDKIRAREVVRMQRIMTRQPDVEKRLEMILRFPELISILRNYFITLRRAAIALDDVSKKVSESYRSHLASENAQQHLYLMADLLPEWISIITISKGPFVKIDKNKDVKVVIEKINQLIKKES